MENNPYQSPDSNLSGNHKILVNPVLTSKTLFKIFFVGFLYSIGPLLIINGIYDLATGSESIITFNDERLSGLSGFIGVIIAIPIFSLICAIGTWLFVSLGLWLHGFIKPVRLEFK